MPSSRQTSGTAKLASTSFRASMILPISKFRTLHVELLYIRENSTSDDFGSGGRLPHLLFMICESISIDLLLRAKTQPFQYFY